MLLMDAIMYKVSISVGLEAQPPNGVQGAKPPENFEQTIHFFNNLD